MSWRRLRPLAPLLAALAAVLALHLSPAGGGLSLEALAAQRAALLALVAERPTLAAAGYVLVYAGAVALSLPGAAVLTLAGGFLFGALWGTALAVLGATAGATAVFLLARAVFGGEALARLGPRAERLAAAIRRDALPWLLALRLVPVFPFFLVNLVPACVGIRLPLYVVTTLLGIIPATAVFGLAGAGLGGVLDAGGAPDAAAVLSPEVIAALTGLGLLSLAAIPLRRRLARADRAA